MQIAENFPAINNLKEKLLDQLNSVIYNGKVKADGSCRTFYVFKPYPNNLKPAQLNDWVSLQCRILIPFVGGDHYHYLHTDGLCFWSSMSSFDGVPETAVQQALTDGTHLIKGEKFYYRQQWLNKRMTSCELVDEGDINLSSVVNITPHSSAWARARDIDVWLSKPITWAALSMGIALVVGASLLAGYLTMSMQLSRLSEQQMLIEAELGDKLNKQTELTQLSQTISDIVDWQYSNGMLPPTIATVVSVVTAQADWKTTLISWQNRTLLVELSAEQLDIAALVTELESTGSFRNVSVRPGRIANTWQVEVILNAND